MGNQTYDFNLSVGIQEVLDADSAAKVESQVEKQKQRMEEPIEIKVELDIGDAKAQIKALQKEMTAAANNMKKIKNKKKSLGKSDYDDIARNNTILTENQRKIDGIVKQLKAQGVAVRNTTKEYKELQTALEEIGYVEKKKKTSAPRKKATTEVKKQTEAEKEHAKTAEDVAKKTKDVESAIKKTTAEVNKKIEAEEKHVRTIARVTEELEKERKKLKEIEDQQAKNDTAIGRLAKKRQNYGGEVLGSNKPVYDIGKIQLAESALKNFNTQLAKRNQFVERYFELAKIIGRNFVGQYGIDNGLYANLDEFIEGNSQMKQLKSLADNGIKGFPTKDINELFSGVVRSLRSSLETTRNLIASGDVFGIDVIKELDAEEISLGQERQRLYEEREAQLTKINALHQEELDLIVQKGKEEVKAAEQSGKINDDIQLKLQRKKSSAGKIIPQTYVIPNTNYEVQKGTVGWNLYEQDKYGGLELIATYETLNELRKDSNLIAKQETQAVETGAKAIKEETQAIQEQTDTMQQQRAERDKRIKELQESRKTREGRLASLEKWLQQDDYGYGRTAEDMAKQHLLSRRQYISNNGLGDNPGQRRHIYQLKFEEEQLSEYLDEVAIIRRLFPSLESSCKNAEQAINRALQSAKDNIKALEESGKEITPKVNEDKIKAETKAVEANTEAAKNKAEAMQDVSAQTKNIEVAYESASQRVSDLREELSAARDEQEILEKHAKVYGYTLNMSAQQAGRIQSTLEKSGDNWTTSRAEAIPSLLSQDWTVHKYNSGGYGIERPLSTSYTQITKTEYEYALYLQNKIKELNVGWKEGLLILGQTNDQLVAAQANVVRLENAVAEAEKEVDTAYERMTYAHSGIFGDENIKKDKQQRERRDFDKEKDTIWDEQDRLSGEYSAVNQELQELEGKYENIINLIHQWQQLNERVRKISGKDSKELRNNIINELKSVPEDLAKMISDTFFNGLQNGFKGIKTIDLVSMVNRIKNVDLLGSFSDTLEKFQNIDFNNFDMSSAIRLTAMGERTFEPEEDLRQTLDQIIDRRTKLIDITKQQTEEQYKLWDVMSQETEYKNSFLGEKIKTEAQQEQSGLEKTISNLETINSLLAQEELVDEEIIELINAYRAAMEAATDPAMYKEANGLMDQIAQKFTEATDIDNGIAHKLLKDVSLSAENTIGYFEQLAEGVPLDEIKKLESSAEGTGDSYSDAATRAAALGEEISEARQEAERLAKISGAIGFHGTPTGGYSEVDMGRAKNSAAYWLTDNVDLAAKYANGTKKDIDLDSGKENQKGIYTYKVNGENVWVVDAKGHGSGALTGIKADRSDTATVNGRPAIPMDSELAYKLASKMWYEFRQQADGQYIRTDPNKKLVYGDPDYPGVVLNIDGQKITAYGTAEQVIEQLLQKGVEESVANTLMYLSKTGSTQGSLPFNKKLNTLAQTTNNAIAMQAFANGADTVQFDNISNEGVSSTMWAVKDPSKQLEIIPKYIASLQQSEVSAESAAVAQERLTQANNGLAASADRVEQQTEEQANANRALAGSPTLEPTEGSDEGNEKDEARKIIDRDTTEALAKLRTALNNKTELVDFNGATDSAKLEAELKSMVNKILGDNSKLSFGSVIVEDDIARISLYNKELGVTVSQLYKIDKASNQLSLDSERYKHDAVAAQAYSDAQKAKIEKDDRWLIQQLSKLDTQERKYKYSNKKISGNTLLENADITSLADDATKTIDGLVAHIKNRVSDSMDGALTESIRNEILNDLRVLDNEIKVQQYKQYAATTMKPTELAEAKKEMEYMLDTLESRARKNNVFGAMAADFDKLFTSLASVADGTQLGKFIDSLGTVKSKLTAEIAQEQEVKKTEQNYQKLLTLQEQLYESKKKQAKLEIDGALESADGLRVSRELNDLEVRYEASLSALRNEEEYYALRQRELSLEKELQAVVNEQLDARNKKISDAESAEEDKIAKQTELEIKQYDKEQSDIQNKQIANYNELIKLQKQYNEADYRSSQAQLIGGDQTPYQEQMASYAQRMAEVRKELQLTVEQQLELDKINHEHGVKKDKLFEGFASSETKKINQDTEKAISLQNQLYEARKKLAKLEFGGDLDSSEWQKVSRTVEELEEQYDASISLINSEERYYALRQRELELEQELRSVIDEQLDAKHKQMMDEESAKETKIAKQTESEIKQYDRGQIDIQNKQIANYNELIRLQKKYNEADYNLYQTELVGGDQEPYKEQMESYAQRMQDIRKELQLTAEQQLELDKINHEHNLRKESFLDGITSADAKKANQDSEKSISLQNQLYEAKKKLVKLEVAGDTSSSDWQKASRSVEELEERYDASLSLINSEERYYALRQRELALEEELRSVIDEQLDAKNKQMIAAESAEETLIAKQTETEIGQYYKEQDAFDKNKQEIGSFARWKADIKNVGMLSDETVQRIQNLENAINHIDGNTDLASLVNEFKDLKSEVTYETTQSKAGKERIDNIKSILQEQKRELQAAYKELDLDLPLGDGAPDGEELRASYTNVIAEIDRCISKVGELKQEEIAAAATSGDALREKMNQYKSFQDTFITEQESQEALTGEAAIKKYYQQLDWTMKQISKLESQISSRKLKSNGSMFDVSAISGLEAQRDSLVSQVKQIATDIRNAFGDSLVFDGSSIELPYSHIFDNLLGQDVAGTIRDFFGDMTVHGALGEKAINQFALTLQNAQVKAEEFANAISTKFDSVKESMGNLLVASLGDAISPDHPEFVAAMEKYKVFEELNKEYSKTDSASWDAGQALNWIRMANDSQTYTDSLVNAIQRERQYFAARKQYEHVVTSEDYDKVAAGLGETAKATDTAKEKLENYVKGFSKFDPIITDFTTSVDGISKIDFSYWDENTNTFRTFFAEMGKFTDIIHPFETTMNNLTAGSDAAKKSLMNLETVLTGLNDVDGVEGVRQELMQQIQVLRNALTEVGTSKDVGSQIMLKNVAANADKAAKSVKKLIDEGKKLSNLGKIDMTNDDIQGQMLDKIKASAEGASISNIKFSDTMKDVTYTLTYADGQVVEMTAHLYDLSGAVIAQQNNVDKLKTWWQDFGSSFGNIKQDAFRYVANMLDVASIIQGLRTGFNTVKEIDSALTELRKVTNETDATYSNFLQTMSKSGAVVGSTVKDLTTSAADWARLGYSIEEAGKLAENTMVLMNVSEFDNVADATDSMISAIQAFKDENTNVSDFSMDIIDVFNQIGNSYAISTSDLADSLTRSSASLVAANNTLEQAVALTTAANTTIQNPEVVGTTLKTLAMRIRGVKTELEEAGEDTEGMIVNTSKLQAKVKALTNVDGKGGIDILTNSGEFKSTYDILLEISKVWEKMGDMDQAALLEIIAGKRAGSAVAGILQNGDILESVYRDALGADGSAMQELNTYLDSVQGKLDQLSNSTQTMWMNFMNSEALKVFIDIARAVVDATDKVGLLNAAVAAFVAKTTFKSDSFMQFFDVKKTEENIEKFFTKFTDGANSAAISTAGLNVATKAASVGVKLLNSALSMGISLLAGFIIEGVVKFFDNIRTSSKEAAEAAEEAITTYQNTQNTLRSQKGTIDELAASYEKLSKGVNASNNENIRLSTTSYQEYLDVCNDIADICPSLVAGFDAQGNAILSCKGNVEELTQAYKDMIVAANNAVLVEGKNIFKAFKDSSDEFKTSNHNNKELTYSTVQNLDKILHSVDLDAAIEKYANTGSAAMVQIVQALKDAGLEQDTGSALNPLDNESGYDFIKRAIQENRQIVQSIVSDFNTQVSTEVSKIQPLAEAYINNAFLKGDYTDLSFEAQDIINSIVSKFDFDFYSQFESLDDMYNYLSNMLSSFDKLSTEELTDISDALSLQTQFERNDINLQKYRDQLLGFVDAIKKSGLDKKIQEQILQMLDIDLSKTDSIGKEVDDMLTYVNSIIDDKTKDKILQLSYSDLQIINSDQFKVEEGTLLTWDQLKAKIKEAKIAMTEDFTTDNFAEYAESISAIQTSISTYKEALESLESGTFTFTDFMELIGQFPELADGVDMSSKEFRGLSNNLKRAIRNSPDDLVDDLKDLRAELVEADKSTDYIDQLIESIENMPSDAVDNLTSKYSTLADEINAAKIAQTELQKAMSENPNEGYETRGEAIEAMKTLMEEGKIGSESELWSIAEAFGFSPDSAKTINENADALHKFITTREKWYATDDDGNYTYEGIESFIEYVEDKQDVLDKFGATWSYEDGQFEFDLDNEQWEEFAKAIGLTSAEFSDLMVQIGQFFGINWGDADDALAYINRMTDGIEDPKKKLEQYGKLMEQYFGEDSEIDLTKRPIVDGKQMQNRGWTEVSEDDYATVYSSAYTNSDETIAITVTPILPDGKVLTPHQLEAYATEIANGADPAEYEFEVDGKTYTGEDIVLAKHEGQDAIEQANKYAEALHKAQEEYQKLLELAGEPLEINDQLTKDAAANKEKGLTEESVEAISEYASIIQDVDSGVSWVNFDELAKNAKEAGVDVTELGDHLRELQDAGKLIDLRITDDDPLGLSSFKGHVDTAVSYLNGLGVAASNIEGNLQIDLPSFVSMLQASGWTQDKVQTYISSLLSSGDYTFSNGENVLTIETNADIVKGQVTDLYAEAENAPDETIKVDLTGNAQTALDSIITSLAQIQDKTITITTNKKTNFSFGFGGDGELNGTAHAHGTAYKSGSWGAPKTTEALVGELGPELRVRGNQWTLVGQDGAEFTDIRKGDIVFNH